MSYPIGTICIGQKHKLDTEYNGIQCEVIEAATLQPHFIDSNFVDLGPTVAYRVRWTNGNELLALPHNLKRKSDYDEEKRAEDRKKVSKLISDCLKAIEAGEKV